MKLDFIDVRRAYFHAKARRPVFIELPAEEAEEGMCGELQKSMDGTRDVAQNWEREYCDMLEGAGFTRGLATSCAFYDKVQDIRVVVHGDDFSVLGYEKDLGCFRERI